MPKLGRGRGRQKKSVASVVDILPSCQNEFKVLFLFWHLYCGWKMIVKDARQISSPTNNLQTGQHFTHNIQRGVSYESFAERKWWGSSGSKENPVCI
jgi:hypothetical protein